MKHLFKKGLSLLLAVLMVTSMLPMSTLAAAVTNGRTAGDGVYSTREDADPPEAELPDETGEDLTDAPADLTDGEEVVDDVEPVDEEPADAAAADAEDDLRVELPVDMEMTAEPAADGEGDLRVELPADMESSADRSPVDEGLTTDPTYVAGADTEGDLRAELPAGEDQNGDRPEQPDTGEEPDEPAKPLWRDLDVSLSFVVEEGKVMYVVDIASSHGGLSSGNWGLAIVPSLAQTDYTIVGDAVGDGTISPPASATALKNAVLDSTGLPEKCVIMTSGNGFNFAGDGSYQLKGEMPAFNDLLKDLQDPDAHIEGASFLDPLTGIPFTAILWTQGNPNGLNVGEGDYHPAGHIRDEVYTLDLSAFDSEDPQGSLPLATYDGGGNLTYSYDDIMQELTQVVVPVQITNDGTGNINVHYNDITVLSGSEYGGVNVTAIEGELAGGASDNTFIKMSLVINQGVIAAFDAGGGTVNLSVPYTQVGSDSVQYANITINIFASPLVITVKPLVFIMTEGDTAPQTKTAQITSTSMGVYVYGGLDDAGYGGTTYYSNLTLSGGGAPYDDEDDEDFNAIALICGEDGFDLGLSSAPVQVTFDPVADADMVFVANDDDTNQTYIDQIVIYGVNDENFQYGNLIVPIQIIVKPKLRTQYTLSYDVNGNDDATAPPSSSMYPPDLAEEGDPTSVIVAEGLGDDVGGKKFLGWNEDPKATAGDPAWTPGDEVVLDHNVKLYAIWETNLVTITFHKNDGVTPETTATVTGEPKKALSTGTGTEPTWTRTGYTKVAGWFTGPQDSAGAATVNVFPDASMDVYAHWTPNDITITYAKGSCTGATFVANGSTQTVKYDQTNAVVRTSAEVFASIPTGWNFVNWKVSDSKSYAAGDTFDKITGELTLTAQWTIDIQFDVTSERPSGATGTLTPPATQKITPGGTLTDTSKLVAPGTLTGYSFDGWYPRLDNGNLGATAAAAATTYANPTTLVAKWTINKYTLTYDTNGHGSVGTTKGNIDHGTVETLVDPAANKKTVTESNIHWVWQGWADADKSTKITQVTMDDNKTVYAIWAKDSHTVSYDGNSGTLDTSHTPSTITCGGPYTVSSVDPTRSGYNFTGWNTEDDGSGTSYAKGATISAVTGDITLYAQWSATTNTVKYTDPASSGANMPGNATITAGAVTLSAPTSVPTGWTFVNWKVQGGTTTYTGTQALTGIVGDLTLEAQWKVDVTYVSTYGTKPANLTGATAVPYNTNITVGAIAAASGDTFTSDIYTTGGVSYRFNGWTASPAANISKTTVGATDATVTGPVTLTASWVGQSSVEFNLNGGTLTAGKTVPSAQSGDVSTAIPTTPTATATGDVTKTGYTFGGWAKNDANAAASAAVNVANIQFPATAGTTDTYYAIWTVNTYTVTFKRNHNTSDTTTHDTKTTNYNTALGSGNYPANPSRTGYTFGGWYPNPDGSGTAFTNATVVTGDTTVYAKWTANTYDVTYAVGKFTDGQIKSGESPQTVTYDDTTCVVKEGDPTKTGTIVEPQSGKSMTGWNFVEWNASANGTGTTWAVGADLSKITAAMTLTAQWTVDVDFKANIPTGEDTATGNPSSVADPGVKTAPAGKAVTNFPGNLAALANYTFTGWNTKADGSGTAVTSATTFDAPATVYAQWKAKTYTVSFVDNDETAGNPAAEKDKNYGSSITLPSPNGTKTGYTFAGWYGETGLTTLVGAVGANYTVTGNATLYGKWSPADVTIVYQTAVGTTPGNDAKKYDATDYAAKNKNTIKNTAGAGWNASETIFTDDSGNRWQFNGWDILKADGSVLKQVNSAAAINPVNTANGVVKKDDGTYTLTLKANWTQLYTVTYNANGHGTVDTSKNVVDHVAWAYNVLDGSDVITTGGTWSGSYFTDAAGKHWKFNGWLASSDGKTYNKGSNLAVSQDITLTAQWDEYYLVTLAPPVITDTSTALGVHATVTFGTSALDSSYTNKSVWVKKDDGMAISSLALKSNTNDYIFAKWTQTSATAGAFTTATGGTSAADTFTPAADTTLTPNYWRKPTLTAKDSYHQNFATDAAVTDAKWGTATNKKATNSLPAYTWTKNNATLASSDELQIELTSGTWTTLNVGTTAGAGVDVVKSTDASGNVTYTFQRDYLMTLVVPMGTTHKSFNIRVQSDTPDTTTTNHDDTTRTAVLEIAVNPDPLTKVDIQVEDTTSATANVNNTARDAVTYKAHTPTTIDKDNQLTYAWYYGPTKATQKDYSTEPANKNATNTSNATGNLPADKNAITGVTGPTVDVNAPKYKGMYIYAVVTASNTGYGAVITNSIAVDYDATVTVKKDTNTVSADTGYEVYLLEKKDSNAAGYATMPATKVSTTWNSTKNYFETTNSALTGGVTYDVYVNKVEGDTTYYVKTGQTVSPTSQSATVNFYSVNAKDTNLKHAKDNASADVGEDFSGTASAPTTAFTTTGAGANTITVNSTDGVFAGTQVTAAASKAWGQDYWWNWQSNGTGTFTSAGYGTEHQVSGAATKAYTISAKTYIGGQMEQKTYTVKGNVWALGNNTNAGVKDPLLTANGHSFSGTWASNGKHKGVVTFTVPKSGVAGALNSENYVISATPYTGTETGLGTVSTTTLVKYAEYTDVSSLPNNTTSDNTVKGKNALTNDTIAQVTANNNGAFTIVVTASNWTLRVEDDDGTKAVDQSAAHTTAVKAANNVTKIDSANTTTTWTQTFANYASAQKVYNVTVSNPGNTDLKVSLVVKKDGTTIYDGTAAVASDSANGVTFTGLDKDANSFDLAAAGTTTDSKTFVVTLPNDLDNNDDVTYSFEFTSKDKNDATIYGPSITYNLNLVVNPIPVKSVSIKANGDGTFSADALTFDAANAPLDAGSTPTLTTANDLTYQWYVGTQPQLNATTGAITNASSLTAATGSGNATATYTPVTADGGKTLWLVVSGKNNASMAAKASVAAPYRAAVTILENTTATTDYSSYNVYLVPTTVNTQPADWSAAGIVKATHKDGDAQGVFTTGADLVNGTTYNVWTNVVKGTTGAVYKNNGALGTVTDGVATKTVTYYSVTVNETTYDNTYTGLTGTAFFGTGDGTTATTSATGNTGITATAAAGATTVASGGWVVSGTDVTFTHAKWDKDYTLAWTGATKQGTDGPTSTGSTATATITANKTVDAELTLNLYTVALSVDGPGTLSEVKMNDGTQDFTASAGNLHATGSATAPIGKGSYTFTIPKGDYTVLGTGGTGTDILYYKIPANDSTNILPADIGDKSMTVADNTSSFHIQLNSIGQYMLVEDDQKPVDNTTITAHSAGTAGWTGTAKTDGAGGSTIHLPYGYTAAKTVEVTVANNSAENNHLYDVTWTPAATGNSSSIEATDISALDGSKNILFLTGGTVGDPLKATLTVKTGLAVGTHTYTADVTFNTVDNNATNQPKVTYTLTVVVDPAEFTAVSITKASGTAADIGNGTMVEFGESLLPYQYTTTAPDLWQDKGITAGTDYTYTWYATPADKTLTGSWAGGTFTPATAASATKLDPKTGTYELEGSTIAQHPGEKIWLVVSGSKAEGAGTNVIKAAISNPVTTGFQPVVKVSVDGALQSDGTGYTATIDDGTTTWNTVWDTNAGGFVPVGADGTTQISLDATKSYTAKVSRAQGDATNLVALDNKLSNTSTANTVTAPYFTVNAVETKAFEAITGLGEDFNDNGTDKLTGPDVSFTLGGAALADGTPVLSGQSVTAKTDAWTQDYKLTWYTKMDATTTVPTRDTSYEGTTPAMTARGGKVDSASTSGTGYTVTSVTDKLYVGGRLDQNTYTINVTISGTGSVASVSTTQNADPTVTFTGTLVEGAASTNNTFDQGDTMKFIVVAGDYDIAATQGPSTNIVSVKWENETAVTGNTLTNKNVAKNPAKATYSVVIAIESANLNLTVSDDKATPNTASAGIGEAKGVTNAEVRYFSGIPANDKLVLSLSNSGNKPLDTTMTVYHFDTSVPAADYANASKWGTSAAGYLASAPATAGDLADSIFKNADGRQVITVTGVMADGTTVAAKAGTDASNPAVSAATITIGPGVFNKDDGVYVFRFVGDDKDASTDNPVVYYVLDLTIQPLPITGVTTDTPATAPGAGEKVQLKGATDGTTGGFNNVMVDPDGAGSAASVAADSVTDPALVDGTDVKYQWVRTTTSMTADAVKALLKVDDTSGVISSTDTTKVKLLTDNGASSKQYTVQDADIDGYLYLVAYAPGASVNASSLAVSAAIKTKRTVGVQVSLDGTIQPISGTAEPGYVIYLVEDGKPFDTTNAATGADGTWATTWDGTNKWYQAPVDVDNITYHIYAPSFKGGANYVDTELTVGKNVTTTPVVPYFSVAHTTNMAVSNTNDGFKAYLPSSNTTNKAANQVQSALTVAVSDNRKVATYDRGDVLNAASVPVLKDMNVKVTVDATAASNNADTTGNVKKSWKDAADLHTMTSTGWEPGTATSATTTEKTGIAYPADDGNGKFLIQSGNIAVTEKKSFSATLKQKLFNVTFVVKDNTPTGSNNSGITPSIAGATLKTDTAKETAAEAVGFTATATSIGSGEDGATVSFSNIPVGALWITATAGERTNVDGYTWNATGDALNDPKDPGKIVNTDTTDATNKHAGNTIQIQYSSNAIRWFDNFNTADGTTLPAEEGGDEFVQSGGFQKVDTARTGPFLALKEGYSTDASAVLTYKVRVKNTGANDLLDFRISQDGATVNDLIADLTKVKVYDEEGNAKSGTTDVTAMGFTLLRGDTVEFEVTIPSGADEKDPRSLNYTSTFQVISSNEGAVAGGNYNPAYRVKPNVSFDEGNAKVIYGNNKFEDTPVDIASAWDTAAYNPDFAFSVLTEAETKTHLSATTLADNIYYAGEGGNKLPAWLVLDPDSGAVTFDNDLYATDVNVRVKDATGFDNYVADEVANEVVFYIKAVDQDTLAEYYTSYTVNVEPGQLKIQNPSFTYTDDEAVGGQNLDKSKFTYDSVTNRATAPLDVIPASAITDGNNTAEGNNTPKDGTVYVNDGTNNVHTATWTLAPEKYVSEVETDYVFTVTYKPQDNAEKWNYKPDTYTETITAKKPDMDLLFSDVLGKAGYEPAGAELKVGRAPDDGYSTIATDDNAPYAPAAMDQAKETYRKGEYIVYLDTEPKYVVTLTGIGDIYNVKVTEELNGFKVVAGDLSFANGQIHDAAKTFTLELAPMSGTTNQWAGTHTAKYTVTGNSKEDGTGDPVTATYELEIPVQPKVIAEAHVTGPTEPAPDVKPSTTITVTAKDPEGEDIKPGTPDKHGNTPIKPDVKWTEGGKPVDPSKSFEDGKDYTVTVTLPADPNYTFVDKDPASDPEPNYTKDGKTDTNDDPTKVDEDLTVTVTPDPGENKQNKEVKFEKTTQLPEKSHLEFEDVNANNANDKVTHAVNAVRPTITVVRGEKLGKYNISLGAYDNDVTEVKVTETRNTLPTGTVWSLDPADVGSLAKDGKQTYVLDLTGVDTTKNTGAYTLKLTAEGKDPYGTTVTSTYEINIRVVKAAAPTLMFDDVKQDVAGVVTTDPATTGPEVDDERTINTIVGGQLGKYTIYLGSYGSTSYDVSVKATPSENLAGVYTLTPDCDTMAPVTLTSCGTVANAANRDETKAQAFELDLTGMSVSKTGTYTLLLEAEGKDINGDDVTATYALTIQVDKAPAGVLKFEDVNAANANDKVAPAPAAVRKTIEVQKGQALGKYLISLGAYGNTVNDVTVTEAELKLPGGTAWTLDPASIATMKNVEATPAGDKTTYTLDMTGVDTAKADLGTYTLKLKAEGTDINGDPTTATYEITVQLVKAPAPELKFEDVNAANPNDATAPATEAKRNISQSTNAKLGKYIISLGSYGGTTTDIKFTERLDNLVSVGVYGVSPDCETLAPVTLTSVDLGGGKQGFELDLSGMDTKTSGTYTLTLTAKGKDINGDDVTATYTLTITLRAPGGGGGGGGTSCPTQVTYLLGLYGTTNDPTMEMVSGSKVKTVPNVTAVTGYKFLGWSLVGPTGDAEQDAKRALVDPKNVSITTDTVFYAVYQPVYAVPQPPIHKHYVIGYPNGNFGPADNIDRASVATIIARAVLPNFVEGADYGNPGGYSDVNGHWAASAIAYCSKYGVFNGYTDGTFKPNQPISRQELALVMARLNGVQSGGSVPFTDIGDAGQWAVDGIYTAYINGWVNGYTDGTFKPVNPIRRDETVKIFNAYLHRGVNAEGLENLTEYVHSGVASNNSENGTNEYMTWPDVTKDQWAYYEIIEAANDHEFAVDSTLPKGYAVPEQWTKCWIDEKWRYHDDANDGGPSAVAEALPNESGLDD